MNTWLTELIYAANERVFTAAELDRMDAYYKTVPARLDAVTELERLEAEVAEAVRAELTRSGHAGAKELGRDAAESLRVVAQAALADDPRLLERQLGDHLRSLAANVAGPAPELAAAFAAARAYLGGRLTPLSAEVVDPYLKRLVAACGGPAEPADVPTEVLA